MTDYRDRWPAMAVIYAERRAHLLRARARRSELIRAREARARVRKPVDASVAKDALSRYDRAAAKFLRKAMQEFR